MLKFFIEDIKERVMKDAEDKVVLKAEVKQPQEYITHVL